MTHEGWFCPLCHTEGTETGVVYCPVDGGMVRPQSERGAEWIGKPFRASMK